MILGDSMASEGIVEVCYFNIWGLISNTDWNDRNAAVVCCLLEFTGTIR